jgi:cysteinyl-tRNA synthetase
MAKSANNFYTLRDLEEKFANTPKSLLYRAIRLSFMNAKYGESVDFSFAKLEQNFINITKFDEAVSKLSSLLQSGTLEPSKFRRDLREELQDFIGEYVECLENDFNMPEAISVFNAFVSFSNTHVDSGLLSKGEAESIFEMFKTFDFVL